MNKQKEITLKDLWDAFAPKIWLIALVGIIFGAFAYVRSVWYEPETYTSYSLFYVSRDHQAADGNDLDIATEMVSIYQMFLDSDIFYEKVIHKLPETIEKLKLSGAIDVDPQKYANLTPSYLRAVTTYATHGKAGLKIAVKTTDPDLSLALSTCIENLAYKEVQENIPNYLQMSIFQTSMYPKGPDSKSTVSDTIVAFIIGAAATALVICVINILDTTIYDKKKIADVTDVPVLGIIPRQSTGMRKKGA